MATVRLEFTPPFEEDYLALLIFEATAADGPYVPIERTAEIGTYPNYIHHYTTTAASSELNWFSVAWEDSTGKLGPLANGIKGGSISLVSKVVERVLQRDSTLSYAVTVQEAEAVISTFYGADDPYTVNSIINARVLNGLVYLVLARSLIAKHVIASSLGNAQSVTIGLVSMRSGATSTSQQLVLSLDMIQKLVDIANRDLGIATSAVMLMEEVRIGASVSTWEDDRSRLVLSIGIE